MYILALSSPSMLVWVTHGMSFHTPNYRGIADAPSSWGLGYSHGFRFDQVKTISSISSRWHSCTFDTGLELST